MISRVRLDPTNCDRVYVAALGHEFGNSTERGVFRSTDGGANWQKVLYVSDQTGASDLSMDPTNPQVLYASMWQTNRKFWTMSSGGDGSGLFKSTDGGDHWTELTAQSRLAGRAHRQDRRAVSGGTPKRVWLRSRPRRRPVPIRRRRRDVEAGQQRSPPPAACAGTTPRSSPIRRTRTSSTSAMSRSCSPIDGGKTFRPVPTRRTATPTISGSIRTTKPDDGGQRRRREHPTDGGRTWTAEDYPTAQFYHVATTNISRIASVERSRTTPHCAVRAADRHRLLSAIGGGECGWIASRRQSGRLLRRQLRLPDALRSAAAASRHSTSTRGPTIRWVTPPPTSSTASSGRSRHVTHPADSEARVRGIEHLHKTTNGGESWQQISPDLTYHDPATLGDSGGPMTRDQTRVEYYATVFIIAASPLDAESDLDRLRRRPGTRHPRPGQEVGRRHPGGHPALHPVQHDRCRAPRHQTPPMRPGSATRLDDNSAVPVQDPRRR